MPRLHSPLAVTLAAGCSFSTLGLPGHEDESTSAASAISASTSEATTTINSSTSTSSDSSSGPAPSTSTGSASTCGDGLVEAPEECDDGNPQDADACSNTCMLNYRRVFATSQVYTGNLGGIAGADAKCQEAAAKLFLPGRFQAWISTDTDSPAKRFVHSTVPYVDLDLMPIADNWDDLVDGAIDLGIYKTELGPLPPESACLPGFRVAWTATTTVGAASGPGSNCDGWTSIDNEGRVGQLGYMTPDWTDASASLDCTCAASLYCFER